MRALVPVAPPRFIKTSARIAGFQCRPRSSNAITHDEGAATAALSPRWLSDVKQRIGQCISFGMRPAQVAEAGNILQTIARDWRELVAGSEGFLTSKTRRGLYRETVVWGMMDSMGHVNNVMYNRFAESGRTQWTNKIGRYIDPANAKAWDEILTPRAEGLLLRKITTEFKFPMKWPDHISVYHKFHSEPTETTDAIVLDVMILSELHQRPAARVAEDCVVYDYRKAKKTTLKPFMLKVFSEMWSLQEEAKRVNSERVRDLLNRTRQLELETWDREDAVEDLGSASETN